ncbi:hypothetical protein GUJ93_ZPchr0004g38102 [Zizania palustris]|uniref:Uncharacterized protein n=1 Tax=Zizania palustris TaxID=103762 RepID=A0A8J5S5U1_ZIZPA|nr:hypothetical protein GUJ93_ZPchr0004g38102 [Zizania palustris]
MRNKKQWHNTSVDGGAGLSGRRCRAWRTAARGFDLGGVGLGTWRTAFLGNSVWQTAARGSADGGAEVGAWPMAVWGTDVGGVGIGTQRTAFLGDSIRRMAVRGSGDGSVRLGGRQREALYGFREVEGTGSRLCGREAVTDET